MRTFKLFAVVLLLLLSLLFMVQNSQVVEVRFVIWKLEMSSALMFVGALGVGVLVGWLLGGIRRLRSHR